MLRPPRRRRLREGVLALGLVEAGSFIAGGLLLGDIPIAAFAPILVLGGAVAAWWKPLMIGGLLALFATLMTPSLVAVASGNPTSTRFYAAIVTMTCVPMLAAVLLGLSVGEISTRWPSHSSDHECRGRRSRIVGRLRATCK